MNMFSFVPKGVSSRCSVEGGYEFVTIDSVLAKANDIGFIKMDIEGAALDALRGAVEVLRKNCPVVVASTYHTPAEFFEIKPFLESLNLGYRFMVRNLNFSTNCELETVLMAYPQELD